MPVLHNRLSQAELKKLLLEEQEPRITISFYRYFFIENPNSFRDTFYIKLNELKVFGRVYIAHEGINAQVSVPQSNAAAFEALMESIPGLEGLRLNIAVQHEAAENNRPAGGKSFWVLKVKVRDKIVADGINDPTFNMANRGKYVNAQTFNELSEDPNTIIVDMRNHYEYEVGRFENAIEIPSDTFREQLPMAVEMLNNAKDKNIIMYCTGGIRCEKASAYMLHNGFKNVYHLEGGIINYANKVKEAALPNKFKGKNFVFDDRLGERISDDIIAHCHQCGAPADTHTNCLNDGCHLLFIQCEQCKTAFNGCCSVECKDIIALPIETQKALRKGQDKGNMIFNKSRQRMPQLKK
ncbi:rhodanese-related sulfurtransferase [Ferruginibacter yonginensis]|uniref:tRNA uridine(34) hydroxylase n=1 Tax=Ferruginibacter yonginensis TaxID=1310416 RepID=A0ABV8QQJ8_9BACT